MTNTKNDVLDLQDLQERIQEAINEISEELDHQKVYEASRKVDLIDYLPEQLEEDDRAFDGLRDLAATIVYILEPGIEVDSYDDGIQLTGYEPTPADVLADQWIDELKEQKLGGRES